MILHTCSCFLASTKKNLQRPGIQALKDSYCSKMHAKAKWLASMIEHH